MSNTRKREDIEKLSNRIFHRDQRGTTLVELLVSLLILSVGIIGTIAVLPQAYKGITRAGRVSTLNHLGYQKLDELRTRAAEDWTDTNVTAGNHPATAIQRMVGSSMPNYSITWVVTDDRPAGETGEIRTIVVEVGYMVYDANGNVISPANPNAMTKKYQTFVAQ